MSSREKLNDIINEYSLSKWASFFRSKSSFFAPSKESLDNYQDEHFLNISPVGTIKQEPYNLLIASVAVANNLSERSSRKAQYNKAKEILKTESVYDGGIFIFHDGTGNFRFSLVYEQHLGVKRSFSNFRRFTYFVSKDFTNKTFLKRIGDGDFSTFDKIKEAFSLAAVTNEFYDSGKDSFSPIYEEIASSLKSTFDDKISEELRKNFALLFAIRVIFIGFIQKRKWLGDDDKFLQNFWKEYKNKFDKKNKFYERWLEPLFFEALANPPGRKVAYRNNDFSDETDKKLQMAPYLNGGLFLKKNGYDDRSIYIPDDVIERFFEFLFSYNFTIEENSLDDEDLQLNPEFLGIIFERLVNKADGAVYTPRTEVDLMCRLSLVKWLENNNKTNIPRRDLYELFFREGGKNATSDEQRDGCFSVNQYKDMLRLLESVTICDPAVGSGAFPVGMLHVLDEIEQKVREKIADPDYELSEFERKKRIISSSLYGVEVKEWAVWIAQLRLWITLFIDAPDDMKLSLDAILPSLDFKMRVGDSLVQRIASKMFPVIGHANIKSTLKAKITALKNLKHDFFQNKLRNKQEITIRELALFREIIDEEIRNKKEALARLKGTKPIEQFSFIPEEEKKVVQQELGFKENEIETIESEIKELEEEKLAVKKDEHPLIWNIEFADVFADNGGFDIVIGNPPYVRQEAISDPAGKITNAKEYKASLHEMVCCDFPDYFLNVKGKQIEKIDAKSDLYTYFYIRALRLLNGNGLLTFICSNSWLDVGYGAWLQKFLLNKAPVQFIIDNHAKRSFDAADVNTIISLIEAPRKNVNEEHLVKFVAFKRPFEDVIFSENLLEIEDTKDILKNDAFRVYPISVKGLYEAGLEFDDEAEQTLDAGKYVGDKWGGKYLRAPDIFFTILEKGKDKLVRLGDIAEVRFGIKTGANEFFYLTDEQAKEWGIEKEFLKPVIKSPRECESITISPNKLNQKVFLCLKNKNELKDTNALKYIQAGEKTKITIRQGSNEGDVVVGYENLQSIKNRRLWWGLDAVEANTFWGKELRERLAVFVSKSPMFADCRLYCATLPPEVQAFCNSTIYHLTGESIKRDLGGGGGPRSVMVYEVQDSLVFKEGVLKIPSRLFDGFFSRAIKNIFEECGIDPKSDIPIAQQEPKPLPDRAELDNIVFDAIGLTSDERKEVYRAVCQLVWNRISKARSV